MRLFMRLFWLVVLSFAVMAVAGNHYFEPTQTQWDNSTDNEAIHAQQAVYVQAKHSGNYELAMANALFYFQKAWLQFNRGNKLELKGDLEGAKALYTSAREDCLAEEVCDPGNHANEQRKCLVYVDWHLSHLGEEKAK